MAAGYGYGAGRRRKRRPALTAGPVYHDDAIALFARISSLPDDAQQLLISNTIGDLDDSGIWPIMGFMHVHAAHDAQTSLLCWNNAAYNASVVGATTFTAMHGVKGNGVDAYLLVPVAANALPNFARDAASIATFETENIGETAPAMGQVSATTIQSLGRNSSNNSITRVNVSSGVSAAVADGRVLISSTRSASNLQTHYVNGVATSPTGATASSAPSASNFTYLRSATAYATRRVGFGLAAGLLTPQHHADLATIMNNYMNQVGALV